MLSYNVCTIITILHEIKNIIPRESLTRVLLETFRINRLKLASASTPTGEINTQCHLNKAMQETDNSDNKHKYL